MSDKRDTFKDIEIADRKWRVTKFDALTGSYVAYKLMFQMLPMGMNDQIGFTPKTASIMSKADFIDLQRDCLHVCAELTQVGNDFAPLPVLMSNGVFAVPGLENDVMTVMLLTIHALLFNISGFFDESVLKDLAGSFKGLPLFNAKT